MEWIEANPLPQVCQECEAEQREGDCGSCEYGGLRFYLSEEDELKVSRKGLLRRIERDQAKVKEIEAKLDELGADYEPYPKLSQNEYRNQAYTNLPELHLDYWFCLGEAEYSLGTEGGQHAIPQSELEQWSDVRLESLFRFLDDSPGIDFENDLVAFDTLMHLLDVYGKRHPIAPDLLEASKQRGLEKLREWMNREGES